jgi:hypothetical protein
MLLCLEGEPLRTSEVYQISLIIAEYDLYFVCLEEFANPGGPGSKLIPFKKDTRYSV